MIATSLTLLSKTITENNIGVQSETITQTEVPIIRIEKVYAKEFYEANSIGLMPSLRVRISSYNYSDQDELIYNNVKYSVIRTEDDIDEIVLICGRKVKNV